MEHSILHQLLEITPFRPDLIHMLSVPEWATFQITAALFVIFMTFAQKQCDDRFSQSGAFGLIGYVSLVIKATFGLAVLWDGFYLVGHVGDGPRPIATAAMCIIASQQIVHLMNVLTIRALMENKVWPIVLMDTGEWARAQIKALRKR